ncbi:transcription factor MYB1R1 [Lathyrus oleraceus]|uniref:transcription factor MYB1R1 n=1 Tax=Pisum sativum TaxID=3888 RepID=UPI0021CE2DDB|nr:transcription factor MYB1R1-like [Pisum sativum]
MDENGERRVMLFGVNIAAKRSKVNDSVNDSFNTEDDNQNEMELCSFDKPEDDDEKNENPDSGQSSNQENRKKKMNLKKLYCCIVVKQWTKNEHKAFLVGLQTVGRGKWKDISRNYVKTKTSTQVASHAQKFFLRQRSFDKTKRQSVFDMMLDYEDSETPSPSPSRKPSPSNSI